MEIRPSGSAPSRRAPAEYFTGAVWQDPIVETPAPGDVRASVVHFEPGARTAWHTHPAGQTLYILSGVGRVQSVGGPVREVRAGDVVWFPPNEKHWHGAGPQTTMAHIAMTEVRGGKYVEWMEKVTDQQYQAARGRLGGAACGAVSSGVAISCLSLDRAPRVMEHWPAISSK